MTIIPFPPYRPDAADTSNSASSNIVNGLLVQDELGFSYRPMQSLSVPASATALAGGTPLGGADVVSRAGNHNLFVGTVSTIEQYGATGAWTTIGSGYAVTANDKWSMLGWGNFLLATNTFDGLKQYNVETGGAVTAVANSYSPRVLFSAFNCVFGGDCLDSTGTRDNRLLRNSAINDHTNWISGTGGAGYQLMPDGEEIVGGLELSDSFAVVFQRRCVRALRRAADGSIYTMVTLANGVGAVNPFCIAKANGIGYFVDSDGFKAVQPTSAYVLPSPPVLIGDQKVNRTFINSLIASGGLKTIQAAVDTSRQLIIWTYQKATNASTTVFTDQIAYNYALGEFVPFTATASAIYSLASPGYDMDNIATLYPSMDDPTMPDMDSRVWAGGEPGLFGIDGNNKGGFFNGANLAGVFETGTLALTQSGLVTSLRVITDSPNATCAIAAREQLSDAKVYGPEEVITEGRVMPLVRGNYISARVSIPAGETWTYLRGLDDIKVKPGGSR